MEERKSLSKGNQVWFSLGGHSFWKMAPKTITACLSFLSMFCLPVYTSPLLVEDSRAGWSRCRERNHLEQSQWSQAQAGTQVWSSFWVKNVHKISAPSMTSSWEGYMAQIHGSLSPVFMPQLHVPLCEFHEWGHDSLASDSQTFLPMDL